MPFKQLSRKIPGATVLRHRVTGSSANCLVLLVLVYPGSLSDIFAFVPACLARGVLRVQGSSLGHVCCKHYHWALELEILTACSSNVLCSLPLVCVADAVTCDTCTFCVAAWPGCCRLVPAAVAEATHAAVLHVAGFLNTTSEKVADLIQFIGATCLFPFRGIF